MDQIIAIIPASYVPYVTGAIAVCAVVATCLPPPADGASGFYSGLYRVINFIAANFGHAKNSTAP